MTHNLTFEWDDFSRLAREAAAAAVKTTAPASKTPTVSEQVDEPEL
jgi:hypothetical protein